MESSQDNNALPEGQPIEPAGEAENGGMSEPLCWEEAGGPPPAGIAPEIWLELRNSFNPFQGPLPPDCDLFSLWSGLVALTQEIKLQGRTFKQLADLLSTLPIQLSQLEAAGQQQVREQAEIRDEAVSYQQRQARQLEQILERLEQGTRRETLDLLLDLRDRLGRGWQLCHQHEAPPPPPARSWLGFRRNPGASSRDPRLKALMDGYRMTLERIEDALATMGVEEIPCQGMPFDSSAMTAVDLEETSTVPDSTVLEVYRPGYRWKGELYRSAQVKVSRSPAPAAREPQE